MGEIAETLGALEELSLAATVAMEQAQERVDLSSVWAGVSAELADEFGGKAPVISLEQKHREGGGEARGDRDEPSTRGVYRARCGAGHGARDGSLWGQTLWSARGREDGRHCRQR